MTKSPECPADIVGIRRQHNTDRIRASEIEHAVEDSHGDGDLSGLGLVGMEGFRQASRQQI
jgi:hypothetical protein